MGTLETYEDINMTSSKRHILSWRTYVGHNFVPCPKLKFSDMLRDIHVTYFGHSSLHVPIMSFLCLLDLCPDYVLRPTRVLYKVRQRLSRENHTHHCTRQVPLHCFTGFRWERNFYRAVYYFRRGFKKKRRKQRVSWISRLQALLSLALDPPSLRHLLDVRKAPNLHLRRPKSTTRSTTSCGKPILHCEVFHNIKFIPSEEWLVEKISMSLKYRF